MASSTDYNSVQDERNCTDICRVMRGSTDYMMSVSDLFRLYPSGTDGTRAVPMGAECGRRAVLAVIDASLRGRQTVALPGGRDLITTATARQTHQRALSSPHSTLQSTFYTLHSPLSTLHSPLSTLNAPLTIHHSPYLLYTLQSTDYSPHPTDTLHSPHHTHQAPFTIHQVYHSLRLLTRPTLHSPLTTPHSPRTTYHVYNAFSTHHAPLSTQHASATHPTHHTATTSTHHIPLTILHSPFPTTHPACFIGN